MTYQPEQPIKLPDPWYWTDQDLSQQLNLEISQDHPLKNQSVKTIARRQDNDDVIFKLKDGKYALVHLTWQQYSHEDNFWPTLKIFENWEDIFQNQILPDGIDFK